MQRIFVSHCRMAREVSQLFAVCFQEIGWFTGGCRFQSHSLLSLGAIWLELVVQL